MRALLKTKVPATSQEKTKADKIPKNLYKFDPETLVCVSSCGDWIKVIKTSTPKHMIIPRISSFVIYSSTKKWLKIASQKGEVLEITDNNPTGIKITAMDWNRKPAYPIANLPKAACFFSHGNFLVGLSPAWRNKLSAISTIYLAVTTIERDAPSFWAIFTKTQFNTVARVKMFVQNIPHLVSLELISGV